MFGGKGNDKNILFKKKLKNEFHVILSGLNEIETKFKQHYKEKNLNFIIVLKLNNRYVDQK